jgi:hypothetical protein
MQWKGKSWSELNVGKAKMKQNKNLSQTEHSGLKALAAFRAICPLVCLAAKVFK